MEVNKEYDNNKLSLVDFNEEGVVAIREKTSVVLDLDSNRVRFHDLFYDLDEIILIAQRIKEIKNLSNTERNGLTFS